MSSNESIFDRQPGKAMALSALLCIGGLGLSGYLIKAEASKLSRDFIAHGWNTSVGLAADNTETFPFEIRCIGKSECRKQFNNTLINRIKGHPILPGAGALLVFMGILGMARAKRGMGMDYGTKAPGKARFADPKDEQMQKYLKKTPYFTDKDGKDQRRGYLGLLEDGRMLKAPMGLRCSHAAIMGGPGARKSTGYHKPNMVFDAVEKSTSVVLDLKYPDPRGGFFDMAPAFHEMGRSIQVFTPFDYNTMRLNLLETATTLEAAIELASMIIPEKADDSGSFYRNIERTTLAALLLSIANSETPSMRRVYQQVIQGAAKLKEFIMANPDPEIRENASAMVEIKTDQLTGIVASLANVLAIFRSPSLARATTPRQGQNLDLRACFKEPTLLYVGIPQGEIIGGRGQVLLQLIKRTVDQAMFDVAKDNDGKLPIHTVWYLDEFANLGPLPSIQQNFATMRSYNVSYQVTLQNRAQGEALYGLSEFKSFFENNLQFQIIFPAFLKMSDAELYSEQMGQMTVVQESHSTNRKAGIISLDGSKGYSQSLRAQALMAPDEFLDYPQDKAIIFLIGSRPIEVFMPRLDEKSINIIDKKGRRRKLVNPNHHYYKDLLEEYSKPGRMQEFMKEMMESRGSGDEEDEEKITNVPLEEEFRQWILSLTEHGAHVTPFRDQKKAIISKRDLPQELRDPALLDEWAKKGWLNNNAENVKITTEGGKAMGQATYMRLSDMEFRGRLRLWISSHASLLNGHPAAEKNAQIEEHLLGYYEEESILLPKEVVEEVFGGRTPPEEWKQRRNSRNYYRIPLSGDDAILRIFGIDQMPEKNYESLQKKLAREENERSGKNPQAAATSEPRNAAASEPARTNTPAERVAQAMAQDQKRHLNFGKEEANQTATAVPAESQLKFSKDDSQRSERPSRSKGGKGGKLTTTPAAVEDAPVFDEIPDDVIQVHSLDTGEEPATQARPFEASRPAPRQQKEAELGTSARPPRSNRKMDDAPLGGGTRREIGKKARKSTTHD